MRIVQIRNDQAHWIFEAEEMPEFPPDMNGDPIVLLDISDKPEIQEGWVYDEELGGFKAPPVPDPEPAPEPAPEEPDPVIESLDQIKMDNLMLMMSIADIYVDLQALKGGDK